MAHPEWGAAVRCGFVTFATIAIRCQGRAFTALSMHRADLRQRTFRHASELVIIAAISPTASRTFSRWGNLAATSLGHMPPVAAALPARTICALVSTDSKADAVIPADVSQPGNELRSEYEEAVYPKGIPGLGSRGVQTGRDLSMIEKALL